MYIYLKIFLANPHSTLKITRRRTHGAFPLEYREPFSDAVKIAQERREEQDAISGRHAELHFTRTGASKENEGGNV
ncbi:hypothetical protein OESDEN_01266 [Oesophagostomum dentatum]|uniref:Uncharacterized protein n=1 Tax=Oesophagostomum dentatum TaxID=61180 RepID=A0A0B1TTL3_OESDE|nr:hypothetical protein OESDEN_01266 [Oesophagostomum dentatum]